MRGPALWSAALGAIVLVLAVPVAGSPGGQVREVSIPGKAYAPARLQVLIGDTVVWRNGDSTNHTVTANDGAFDSGYVAPGGSFARVFAKLGRYAYHCTIHKFMRGVVTVVPVALQGPPRAVVSGGRATLQGLAPDGTKEVALVRLGGEPAVARRVAPAGDGSFTVTVRAVRPEAFAARVKRASSAPVRIVVAPRVTVRLRGSTVSGRVVPSRAGSRAALQVYDREHFSWRTVGRGRVDASSRVSVPLPTGHGGRYRLVVRGGHGWADGASQAVVTR